MLSRVIVIVIENGLKNLVTFINQNTMKSILPLYFVEMNIFHCI